jgi:hypothetical protein
MTMGTDNSSFLAEANARRHDAALAAAHDAIERLTRQAQPISFATVAQAAAVSRAWLYRQAEIRDLITRLRAGTLATPPARVAHRASTDSLRQRLDAARIEIARLRADNRALRDQLARHLGAQRARQGRQHHTGPG